MAATKACINCKHFRDGNFNKYTYINPECTQRGTDSAAYMRAFVCGVENPTLFEPRAPKPEREGASNDNGTEKYGEIRQGQSRQA